MRSWPAAPAATDLSDTDLANFESVLREQRRFRVDQLAELSKGRAVQSADTAALEVTDVLERAARHALAEIDQALDRLHGGRYGRCADCGHAIGRDRLDVLPSTPRCMPCQRRIGNGRPSPLRHPVARGKARPPR